LAVLNSQDTSQAEIEDVRSAGGVDQDVVRLEVTMTDAVLVRVVGSLGNAGDQIDNRLQVRLRLLTPAAGIDTLDHLGDEIVRRADAAVIEKAHDAGMCEARSDAGLTLEAGQAIGLREPARVQQLQGDVALDIRIVRQVHDAEAACAEFALDDVG